MWNVVRSRMRLKEIQREREREREVCVYRGESVEGKPDGGELTPAKLSLSDVTTTGERIADPDGVITTFAVRIEAFFFSF